MAFIENEHLAECKHWPKTPSAFPDHVWLSTYSNTTRCCRGYIRVGV